MDWKDYDGLGYLSGRTLEEVERAGFEARAPRRRERDVPIAVLELEQVDAYHLGELFYFFELSSAICALADGVDPFAPISFPRARTRRACSARRKKKHKLHNSALVFSGKS